MNIQLRRDLIHEAECHHHGIPDWLLSQCLSKDIVNYFEHCQMFLSSKFDERIGGIQGRSKITRS